MSTCVDIRSRSAPTCGSVGAALASSQDVTDEQQEDAVGDKDQSMVAKMVGLGVTLAAAWVVQKAIDTAWEKSRGHKPPAADSMDDDIKFSEVAAAAVISGALVALSRVVATRGTARLVGRAKH